MCPHCSLLARRLNSEWVACSPNKYDIQPRPQVDLNQNQDAPCFLRQLSKWTWKASSTRDRMGSPKTPVPNVLSLGRFWVERPSMEIETDLRGRRDGARALSLRDGRNSGQQPV